MDILDQDVDYESAIKTIIEEIKNDEPDPDAGRDDYIDFPDANM